MYMYKICVSNRHLVEGDYYAQLEKVANSGISAILLREKDLSLEQYEVCARKVQNICARAGIDCILHQFIPAAVKLGAKKFHLPFSVFMDETTDIQALHQAGMCIGTSIHSAEDAITAQKRGADYITAGHIFTTDCKKGLPARGLDFLREVCENIDIPVYAIGGINEGNAASCIQAGANGVCMMSAYMRME